MQKRETAPALARGQLERAGPASGPHEVGRLGGFFQKFTPASILGGRFLEAWWGPGRAPSRRCGLHPASASTAASALLKRSAKARGTSFGAERRRTRSSPPTRCSPVRRWHVRHDGRTAELVTATQAQLARVGHRQPSGIAVTCRQGPCSPMMFWMSGAEPVKGTACIGTLIFFRHRHAHREGKHPPLAARRWFVPGSPFTAAKSARLFAPLPLDTACAPSEARDLLLVP